MESETPNSFVLQDYPVVIKNSITDWKILQYTKEDWCDVFKDKVLKFRQGKKTYSQTPYWEHLCESKEITLNRFFELSAQKSDEFLYFDYKFVKDVFDNTDAFIHEFKWADIGLLDLHGEESVLWIGNEGAHTPCHKDTYGCNFVAQLYGRKLWILMPPEETENLKAVRVPYEESSVYSLFNFYTPDDSLLSIKHAYKIILCPGDVLYVPRHWWHYVENLEPAISSNIWIPLDEDHESRLEESLIQYYISNICQDLTEIEAKQILNPNEYKLIWNPCSLSLVEKCVEYYQKHKNSNEPSKPICIKTRFQSKIPVIHIKSFINEKISKFTSHSSPSIGTNHQGVQSKKVLVASALINSYYRQTNINSVKAALFEQKIPIS